MAKYRVYLVATASCAVEVEADDGDQAVEKAFEEELPFASMLDGFDLGDWAAASDVYPTSKPEDDYELIEEN